MRTSSSNATIVTLGGNNARCLQRVVGSFDSPARGASEVKVQCSGNGTECFVRLAGGLDSRDVVGPDAERFLRVFGAQAARYESVGGPAKLSITCDAAGPKCTFSVVR